MDGWDRESTISVVDGLSLGVGVGGWGIGVFHNWCSLNFYMFDDGCSGDHNFVWAWDSNWFLDINVVGVDGDLSWVVVNSVEEGGGDSDTWSEDLWFVDDGRVSGDPVFGSVVDGLLHGSCKVWDGLSNGLLYGGVVTLYWDCGLHGVVLDCSWDDSVVHLGTVAWEYRGTIA